MQKISPNTWKEMDHQTQDLETQISMTREEPQHSTLKSTHKLLTKIIAKKYPREKSLFKYKDNSK